MHSYKKWIRPEPCDGASWKSLCPERSPSPHPQSRSQWKFQVMNEPTSVDFHWYNMHQDCHHKYRLSKLKKGYRTRIQLKHAFLKLWPLQWTHKQKDACLSISAHNHTAVFCCLPGIHMFLLGLALSSSAPLGAHRYDSVHLKDTQSLPLHPLYKDWKQPRTTRHAHHRACNTTHYWAHRVERTVMGETSTAGSELGAS